jgi:hypothetical protein
VLPLTGQAGAERKVVKTIHREKRFTKQNPTLIGLIETSYFVGQSSLRHKEESGGR